MVLDGGNFLSYGISLETLHELFRKLCELFRKLFCKSFTSSQMLSLPPTARKHCLDNGNRDLMFNQESCKMGKGAT